jgi:hypothetical protein
LSKALCVSRGRAGSLALVDAGPEQPQANRAQTLPAKAQSLPEVKEACLVLIG